MGSNSRFPVFSLMNALFQFRECSRRGLRLGCVLLPAYFAQVGKRTYTIMQFDIGKLSLLIKTRNQYLQLNASMANPSLLIVEHQNANEGEQNVGECYVKDSGMHSHPNL